MTGKELIVYILTNNLENEEVLSKDGVFVGFMDEREAAAKFNVGIETIRAWYILGYLKGFPMNTSLLFLRTTNDPRLNKNDEEK